MREAKFTNSMHSIYVYDTYIIDSNGEINITTRFDINPTIRDVQRIGITMVIPNGFENLEYYGLGPNENYRDRKCSSKIGLFQSKVEEQHFPFVAPGENGGHENTKLISLNNETENSITFFSKVPVHFDIHHNTVNDYLNAKHEHELIRRNECYLNIDVEHCAIGGDMGWSTVIKKEDRVLAKSYLLQYKILTK